MEKLYPAINYPVSRGTAKISPLLRWDHSVSLFVSKFELNNTPESSERRFTINLTNEEFAFVAGHNIDGIVFGFKARALKYMLCFYCYRSMPVSGYRILGDSLENVGFDERFGAVRVQCGIRRHPVP